MIHERRRHALSLCTIGIALVTSPAWCQQTYHLTDKHAVGDVSEVESTMEMTLNMQPTVDGKKMPAAPYSDRGREKYVETVLGVDDKGKPSAIRRAYSMKHEMETDDAGKPQLKAASLEGKTVMIKRDGDKETVTVAAGKIDAKDRDDLAGSVTDQPDIFPDHDLAPGDEWSIDAKGLLKSVHGADKAEVKAKLLDIVPFQGRQCARMQLSLEVSSKAAGSQVNMTMKLSGIGYEALDLQRLLSLKLSGPVTASGESKDNGTTVVFNGKGTMTMTLSQHWTRTGGKAVVEPAKTG